MDDYRARIYARYLTHTSISHLVFTSDIRPHSYAKWIIIHSSAALKTLLIA